MASKIMRRTDLQQSSVDQTTTILPLSMTSTSSGTKISSGIGSGSSETDRSTLTSFNATINPTLVMPTPDARQHPTGTIDINYSLSIIQ